MHIEADLPCYYEYLIIIPFLCTEFACDVSGCPKKYDQKWKLQRHKARVHESEERYCETCVQGSRIPERNAQVRFENHTKFPGGTPNFENVT